jgi:flavodoxin
MASQGRTLLAYFSRPGENYYYGGRTNLEVGNTQVVADLIAGTVTVDVHRLTAADPYSPSYAQTVARNVDEQVRNARPALGEPLPDLGPYDTILIGSPIWNVQPPMIMKTFIEALDLSGKALFPFTTHAMSGLGRAAQFYRDAAPGARIGEGLAIRGEEAAASAPAITTWLRAIGVLA